MNLIIIFCYVHIIDAVDSKETNVICLIFLKFKLLKGY